MLVTGDAATGGLRRSNRILTVRERRRASSPAHLIAALAAAVGGRRHRAAAADPSIGSKRAEAQRCRSDPEVDSSFSHATEAYNLANVQLAQLDADLSSNGRTS